MGSGVRYRYKGKFISAAKAAKLGNLRGASKYVKTAYTIKGRTEHEYRGYRKPVETLVKEALERDRQAARDKYADIAGRATARAEERKKQERQREQERAEALAEKAVRRAINEDISIDEAFDEIGFDPDQFEYFDYDDVAGFAQGYIDEGAEYFDFEMTDLEDEDKYAA